MSLFAPIARRRALLVTASALAVMTAAPAALAQAAGSQGGGQSPAPGAPHGANPGQQTPAAPAQETSKLRSFHGPAGDVTPSWGDIDAFWGDINPFWGDIDPFWGDINPFWGDINPFWGDIDPFWGDIDPFWGDINAFWGDIDPFQGGGAAAPAYEAVGAYWSDVGPLANQIKQNWAALGAYSPGAADYAQVQTELNQLVQQSEATWGQAVTTRTGKSFREGFADSLLAKYGVDLDDPATLAGLSAADRSKFFMEWYDGLMDYAGVDHVDHWMAAVRWTPQITQIQGQGAGTIIGLLDAAVVGDPDIANNITSAQGYSNSVNGHGTSVASLMVADHDGRGVMGIGPHASVVSYNPFDASGTASWEDVHSGVLALQANGASVVNMSLGVSGWTLHQEWKNALAGTETRPTVFVLAAGNSGATQTTDIEWDWQQNPALLVVGSVDPSLTISDFSNRPGSACLLDNGVCTPGNELYNRFLVAPGELILVSDGHGGLERRSGTSFAAPLVSGAITLLHDRWPWLANYPHETADIILHSAHDLGAPGPDPVYGWGLLDVEASQSPLDFNTLTFYEYRDGVMTEKTASQVKSAGLDSTWEAEGVYVRLFEQVGATHRDFAVPLSSRLVGQKSSVTGSEEYFQSYIQSRLTDWITGGTSFTDIATQVSQQPGQWSFAVSTGLPAAPLGRDELASQAPHMGFRMSDPTGRFAFNAGHGQGAMVLGQVAGFTHTRDYASADGGVNPILGFASGGPFADVEMALSKRTTLAIGGAERRLVHAHNPALTDYERDLLRGVDDYKAGALNVRLTHRVTDGLTVSGGYARLKEANGLLGVQSTVSSDLSGGSISDVATVGASLELPRGMTFAASASAGQTRTADAGQNLASVGAVQTSAYAVSFAKKGVVGKDDLLRVAFTQPLTVEHGKMAFTSVEVVDRTTGEIGPVVRTFDIAVKPRHVAEALYATPVFDRQGEFSLFGRAETQSKQSAAEYMVGARLKLNY